MSAPRTPPHSTEAEFHVLGGILLDNAAFDQVGDRLQPDDLYHESHRIIFEAIRDLVAGGKRADAVSLFDRLNDAGRLDQIGGPAVLAELAERVPTAANVPAHARIVQEKAALRRLIRVCADIAESGLGDVDDVPAFLDDAEQQIYKVREASQQDLREGLTPLKTVLDGALQQLDERYQDKRDVTGVSTGFLDLDLKTAGLQRSDLIVLAARPSMGKTALALNIAVNTALGPDSPSVAVFSLEMSRQQLALRMLASEARVSSEALRTGRFSEADFGKLTRAVESLAKARIYIDDTAALSPLQLRGKCRRLKARDGLDLVIVDYMQLMRVPATGGRRIESREKEIAEISRTMKTLAKDLDVPVLCLSQLNRDLEKRPSKRPQLSDLRESGTIEQDSDIIAFIYRDEVYNEGTEEKGVAEVIIAKHRNGPTGTIRLKFWDRYTRFDNLDPTEDPFRS